MADLWSLGDLCTPWCVHVAATLRIADHIEAGTKEIAALAKAAGADQDTLHRLLRHLISKGVFLEPTPGVFELNDTAHGFLHDGARLGFDLASFGGRMALAWGTLLAAVRTGQPAYHDLFGRPFWDDLAAHPAIAADFDLLMGPGHGVPDPEILADPADWARVKTVVDVGGGSGMLLAEILRAHPLVHGILLDLPRPLAASSAIFEKAGVANRVKTAAQSFFDPLPAAADVYILKSILSDWPDREAIAILKRCAEAARPAGRVLVFTNAGPGQEEPPGLLMMVLLGGRERAFEGLVEAGRQAGLELKGSARQSSGRLIVDFRPV